MAEEIQKYGYRTLADIPRNVRGLRAINDRNYSYVGVLGFSRQGIYGTGAFVAVIDVITKRGRDLNATELSTAA
jgi:outer membrane receptor for ferrienterochelin and colicins